MAIKLLKMCSKCGRVLDFKEFEPRKTTRSKLSDACRDCLHGRDGRKKKKP